MTIISTRLALAALAASCSTGALAQAIVAPDPATGPAARASVTNGDDIVVTAQKREQRIEDVPLTVTALTGAKMADIGVNSLSEVAAYIPGLQIQEQSANNPGFVIRGITSDNGSSQQGARVTLYYNGVDISRSRGAYQDLYDLERIEVVKGPQATLFGTAAAVTVALATVPVGRWLTGSSAAEAYFGAAILFAVLGAVILVGTFVGRIGLPHLHRVDEPRRKAGVGRGRLHNA